MKSIGKTFSQLKFNKLEKCNPKPGYKDSCEGCKNCKKGKGLIYESEECDCTIDPIPYFDVTSESYSVDTEPICITGIVCPVTFEIKFETDDGWLSGANVRLTYPNGSEDLTRNGWFSFTLNNGDCFSLHFDYPSTYTGSKLIRIHLKNHTCNDNYGEIGSMTINYTP